MKLLVLGSEGFIGKNCIIYFQEKDWEVYGCDLVDYPSENYHYTKISRLQPSFEAVFSNIKYDVCINAAGNGSVPVSIEHPITDFEANCNDVINILDIIRLKNIDCKYIHLSSAAVYGNPQKLPVTENDTLNPISPYGFHKQIAELICREYHHLYKIRMAIVRPFSIYGPGLRKQLFWDLYQKCKTKPTVLSLWGTGEESRDFIYITDLLEALNIILNNSTMEGEVYNLANGIEITIKEAANKFIKKFNDTITLKFNGEERHGDPVNWLANVTEINKLGHRHKVDLEEGVSNYINWLKTLR